MTVSPDYEFTEAALDASAATPEWASWLESTQLTPEHARRYFRQFLGANATTEDEMALSVLGGNNMGGGVHIEILRMLARLSKTG